MTFYTYLHSRVSDNKPFYVGKGQGSRAFDLTNRNKFWSNTVSKHGLKIDILSTWTTEKEALDHEKFLILCFKDMGIELTNLTDGGEGVSGFKRSAESNLKVSQNSRSGTLEVREKISKNVKIAMARPEIKAKLHLAQKEKVITNETKEKMSAAHLALLTPEYSLRFKRMSDAVTQEGRRSMIKKLTGLKRVRVACPHCGKEGAKNVMVRWHFDTCKAKP